MCITSMIEENLVYNIEMHNKETKEKSSINS